MTLDTSRISVLTPYLIPESLRGRKVVNLGDGFILRAIERRIGEVVASRCFTPRIAPDAAAERVIRGSALVILGGANQLNDKYTIWPRLTADQIRERRYRFVPFGIGIHGEPGYTDGLSQATRDVLTAVHEQIAYSSWRCPRTVDFLKAQMPELASKLLMTGCPVIYDSPLLDSSRFTHDERAVAVTVTERGDFWDRESATIDFVARRFPRARRFMVLHQNYSPPGPLEHWRHRLTPYRSVQNQYERLRWYAAKRGFTVITPRTADDCLHFYRNVDVHVGSRLHAHLHFLSQNKRTFLVGVDERATGMAEHFGFPLCDPARFDAHMDFDFEIVRARAIDTFATMQQFVSALTC
ncbi:polysaccharide pyruvyl transferase family protein [Cupriavidus sp. 2KB_3]|uniref:polysaccharide pyruvyl transferase family protein n=1 Tax=Cupriavidus sp. 2KB_3 TaxID=3232980 RepID=UPI003F8EC24E